MSTSPKPNRPQFPGRNRSGNGRPPRQTAMPDDPAPGGLCRICRAAPALPDDVACGPCGEQALERARAIVDAWVGMDAERVRELERQELARGNGA